MKSRTFAISPRIASELTSSASRTHVASSANARRVDSSRSPVRIPRGSFGDARVTAPPAPTTASVVLSANEPKLSLAPPPSPSSPLNARLAASSTSASRPHACDAATTSRNARAASFPSTSPVKPRPHPPSNRADALTRRYGAPGCVQSPDIGRRFRNAFVTPFVTPSPARAGGDHAGWPLARAR